MADPALGASPRPCSQRTWGQLLGQRGRLVKVTSLPWGASGCCRAPRSGLWRLPSEDRLGRPIWRSSRSAIPPALNITDVKGSTATADFSIARKGSLRVRASFPQSGVQDGRLDGACVPGKFVGIQAPVLGRECLRSHELARPKSMKLLDETSTAVPPGDRKTRLD
jgi:hypothetical protein